MLSGIALAMHTTEAAGRGHPRASLQRKRKGCERQIERRLSPYEGESARLQGRSAGVSGSQRHDAGSGCCLVSPWQCIQQKQQEEVTHAQAFNANVKAVNDKLNAASALMKANPPDYKGALQGFQEAKDMMPDQDVVWYRLGNA